MPRWETNKIVMAKYVILIWMRKFDGCVLNYVIIFIDYSSIQKSFKLKM